MIKSWMAIAFFTMLTSCSGGTSNEASHSQVNNPATRYVEDLQSDVGKARGAVDKANDAANQSQSAMDDFNKQAQ